MLPTPGNRLPGEYGPVACDGKADSAASKALGASSCAFPIARGNNSQFVAAREDARRSLTLGLQRAFRGKEWKRGRQPRLAAMPKPFSASLWGIGATTGVSGTSKPACYTGDTFCDSRTM